ncbi:MAG: fimbria/pilus outer membrane usher protein [Arsenophonus sp.]
MKIQFTFKHLTLLITLAASEGLAESITIFDKDILEARGIPSSVSNYFQGTSRFLPGINHPDLVVNGNHRGTVSVRFSEEGYLCADAFFMKAAGLIMPKSSETINETMNDKNRACPLLPIDITAKLQPGRNRVELLAPTQLINNDAPKIEYFNGGSAAMLNYNIQLTGNHGQGDRSHSFYASTESGFNINNWIVRSIDSYYNHSGYNTKFHHKSAWMQHTFQYLKSTVQAGQLMLNSPLFSAPVFYGIQVMPESSLLKRTDGVHVSGIAISTSRVEVRQGGSLIYSILVPGGEFVLSNLPVNNFSQDLEVTVIENSGERQSFIVPSSTFSSNFVPIQQDWTFSAGRYKVNKGSKNRPIFNKRSFVSATATFPIKTLHTNITTGLMASQQYTSAGINAKTSIWKGTLSYVQFLGARDKHTGKKGSITQIGHSMEFGDSLTATLSTAFHTVGFSYLTDVIQPNISLNNLQHRLYSASLGWRNDMLGCFFLGLSRIKRFDNTIENYPTLSWSNNIGPAMVSLNISYRNKKSEDNMHYLYISLPIGKTHTSFSTIKEGSLSRTSTNISRQLSDTIAYSIGTSAANNQQYSFNGSLNLQPYYTRLYSNYSYNGRGSHSWSASISGSVMHDGIGILFSPYTLRDTFGVVNVSGLKDAKIQTPAGTVWTNRSGRATVPFVTPYSSSRVELITQGLPHNVEINNLTSTTKSGRGSVSQFDLKVKRYKKILLRVNDINGEPFPQGMTVLDKDGRYLTITGADSYIYLDATDSKNNLSIEYNNGHRCTLNFTVNFKLPKNNDTIETIPVICE